MTIKVAINGYGRIGRNIMRALHEYGWLDRIEIVAINDLGDAATNAHLTKYDTAHGIFAGDVSVDGGDLIVNGHRVKVLAERDPAALPWAELGVDVVYECTGLFRSKETAGKHLQAGAKKVIVSAPGQDVDNTVVYGVNHKSLKPTDTVISNASCTTNCLAPVAKVLHETVGIEHGWLTTTHAYTNNQKLLDVQHKDLRRGRAAAINIIPASTGAAKAIGLVYPDLAGKLHGAAMRVPVPDGSVCDLTFVSKRSSSVDELQKAFVDAAAGSLNGILRATDVPIVSTDIIGESCSSVVDLPLIAQVAENFFRVVAWYDNENAYSLRCVDLVEYMVSKA